MVQISIGDAEPVVEGGELVFTVSLDQPALEDVTMEYTIALDGSASADDLPPGTPLTGTVTIFAGDPSADIVVPTEDDALVEGPEDLRVVLANPSPNAEISDGEGIGTITDNDLVHISISDAGPVEEGGILSSRCAWIGLRSKT